MSYLFHLDGICVSFAIRSHLSMCSTFTTCFGKDLIGGQVAFTTCHVNDLGGDIALLDGLYHRHLGLGVSASLQKKEEEYGQLI